MYKILKILQEIKIFSTRSHTETMLLRIFQINNFVNYTLTLVCSERAIK